MTKYSKGTPSLAKGQKWSPKTGRPWRDSAIGSASQFPRQTTPDPGWTDPAKGRKVKSVDKRAR